MKYTTLQPKVVIQEYEKDQTKHLLLLSKIKKLLRVLTVRKTQKKKSNITPLYNFFKYRKASEIPIQSSIYKVQTQ